MKTLRSQIFLLLLLALSIQAQPATPFHRGVNLSNWFQGSSVQEVQFSRYTYEDFVDIQSLGVDVIRLPINLHGMSSGEPDYIVDPVLLAFLDQIIDWTEELGLHLIIDNHSFSPTGETTTAVNQPLSAIWPQLAEHFIDRDSTLYFEIKNEPYGISAFIWDTIQQNVVRQIRLVDENRKIIVGPTGWNGINDLSDMMDYSDESLIYTFHFYDPFIFSHQGASWTDPSMESLAGVPFPYGASPMPSVPTDLLNTWIQGSMASYSSEGNVSFLRERIDIAHAFSISRNVPIYCGEFGVYMRNAIDEQRVDWYHEVTQYLDSLGIGWTMWDYHGGFGLFESGGNNLFDHDLNIPLVEAMGFSAPPQTEYVFQPDSVGFTFYNDFIGPGIVADNSSAGNIEYYNNENPRYGNYSLHWANGNLYDKIGFDLSPDKDLTYLLTNDFVLTFWVRVTGTPSTIDLRFMDTKTDVPEDHPWRMNFTLSATDLNWDGNWQYFQIPLTEMTESGSWDGAWFDPAGLFDWSAIDALQFAAEHGAFGDAEYWLDEIRIVDPITAATSPSNNQPLESVMEQNYPNPFNPSTAIKYTLSEPGLVRLTIFDVSGKTVEVLVSENQAAGEHKLLWQADKQVNGSGLYFARIEFARHSEVIKMLYLK